MKKPGFSFKRLLLLPVFLVLTLVIGFGELVYLSKSNDINPVFGINNKENVIVGVSGEDNSKDLYLSATATGADARPMLIKKYLEKYNSPLLPYSDLIFELSESYGYEYYWIVAIAQQESNLCKKAPEDSHNCWGYGIHKNGTLKFDNYELAIKSYAEYLKVQYFDKGLNTPELIMKKYCPSSNGSWANGVNQFIEELKNGSF
jgi:general stress protein 26